MTKLCLISDTHGQNELLENLPEADILIHCGDITKYGSRKGLTEAVEILGRQSAGYKILVAGNHDRCFEKHPEECDDIINEAGLIYLEDSWAILGHYKFYGMPWVPVFGEWAFMGSFIELYEKWNKVPRDVDVLITHGPPKYILDLSDGDHAGCAAHSAYMGLINPRLNVFGHIHEGYGRLYFGETMHINCSLINREYKAVNEPVVYELPTR